MKEVWAIVVAVVVGGLSFTKAMMVNHFVPSRPQGSREDALGQ
jgi:hypothetical protein